MNNYLIEEMKKALNENNLGKARSILVDSVMSFEDEETIDRLNKLAIDNGVIEEDDGEYGSKQKEEKFNMKTIFQSGKKWETKKKVAAAATVGLAALAFGAGLLLKRKSNKK